MLIGYFKFPSLTLERYRSASVGSYLDAFTAWLDEHGYRRMSVRRHVRGPLSLKRGHFTAPDKLNATRQGTTLR